MSDLTIAFLLSLCGVAVGFVLIVLLAVLHLLSNAETFGAFAGLALLIPLMTGAFYVRLRLDR